MPRLRSARAHDQVLTAALRLFSQGGIESTTMDAIAEASGVSKATIYKHWTDKDALCLEVVDRLHGLHEPPPSFDTEDVRADVIAFLSHNAAGNRSELQTRMMPHLMAYAARNPEFGKMWRNRVMLAPRAQLSSLLKRAIAAGELDPRLHLEVAHALLLGPMMYQRLLGKANAATPLDLPAKIVEAFWIAHQRPGHELRRPLPSPAPTDLDRRVP